MQYTVSVGNVNPGYRAHETSAYTLELNKSCLICQSTKRSRSSDHSLYTKKSTGAHSYCDSFPHY